MTLSSPPNVPLCVDLDGTLILTDTLFESVAKLLKLNWFYVFLLPIWLLGGKGLLKSRIAERISLQVDRTPTHLGFLAWLKDQHRQGRRLILVTGSHETYAHAYAERFDCFDEVMATTEHRNLTSHDKRQALVERFGERGFDYAGNHKVDLNVWQQARRAIVVSSNAQLIQQARALAPIEEIFPCPFKPGIHTVKKALRLHQWLKNVLVFVPLFTGHLFHSADAIGSAIWAFILMSVCASATYFINDILDVEADRIHHRKCYRPFASGELSILTGAIAAGVMLLISFVLAAIVLPAEFVFILFSYLVLTLTYSLRFKRLQSLDVVTLALLYTIRVLAGAAAIGIAVSFWLLAFSLFLFLSLGLVKRVSELQKLVQTDKSSAEGRGYMVSDLPILQSLGTTSGYLSILVIALYIHSEEVTQLYQKPQLLWIICPILTVWITRIWILTARGLVDEDPVEYAIRDRYTWAAAFACFFMIIIAAIS